jgi:hypothetical protein
MSDPYCPLDARIDDPHQSWSSRNRYVNENEYFHEIHPMPDDAEEPVCLHERGD